MEPVLQGTPRGATPIRVHREGLGLQGCFRRPPLRLHQVSVHPHRQPHAVRVHPKDHRLVVQGCQGRHPLPTLREVEAHPQPARQARAARDAQRRAGLHEGREAPHVL